MTSFSVRFEVCRGCRIVRLGGDLDGENASTLDRELNELPSAVPVVVDLSRVRALTSAGLQALFRQRSFGTPALVCEPGTSVERVLEIVHAHRLVPIYRNIAAAIEATQAA